jgi:long-chain acyl-CoA synthetase
MVDHRAAEDNAGIALLTSGTTGAPKHFHMSHDVIARAFIRETGVPDLIKKPGEPPKVQTMPLLSLPFGNIAGIYSYLPYALARHPITLLEKFTLDDWLAHIREWRPKSGSLPPAAFRMLLDANVTAEDLSSIRFMSTGAATLDPTAHREFETRYGIPILLSYGATEFGGIVSLMTPDDHAKYGAEKFGSVGRPWAGAQLQIVDPVTRALLPAGTEGELEVMAPRMGPDWIKTTDLAMIDADGFLYHRGRSDGAIMRGGFKIVPEMVAAALAEHLAIGAAVVVGIADRRLGEVPVAAYERRPGAEPVSPEELKAHLRRSLPATYLPVRYVEVAELPRTPSLKLDIVAVRRLFEAEAAPV